jgi:hypothetical protein
MEMLMDLPNLFPFLGPNPPASSRSDSENPRIIFSPDFEAPEGVRLNNWERRI